MSATMNGEPGEATSSGPGSAPVLRATVRRLRQLSLDAREGEFLGSERDLQERLAISRPTFRQAVRILEQDQLLVKKMGPRGGCYASRPNPALVARAAALYLRGRDATLYDLMAVSGGLQEQALLLACAGAHGGSDEAAREAMRQFVGALDPDRDAAEQGAFLALERQFERLVLALAGNPALELLLQITRKFVDESPASQALIVDLAMRRNRCVAWGQLGEAILAGDAEATLAIARQQSRTFRALIPGESGDAVLGTLTE